ncbi:MAG: hypothetical protein U9Q81_10895, partial [Pseudomonadota bacterium]|nr:hypothetical protein [Pseudomonadota bacterium]
PREVPPDLEREASTAAHAVCDRVDALLAAQPLEALIDTQLRMHPTHLIAKEDFATASLLALGLERDITGWPVAYFDRRNRKSLDLWESVRTDPRCRTIQVFATLGATDYNTARSAARLAAQRGVENVALGFAGLNKDPWTCKSYLAGHRRALPSSAPRRYVRITAILLGIRDGYREAGCPLKAFHALGMGARDQFPLLATIFDHTTALTADATSPVHDAVSDLVLYHAQDPGERVEAWEAAGLALRGDESAIRSPFCHHFIRQHGHDTAAARAWWESAGSPAVNRELVAPESPLAAHLPLFAVGRGGVTAEQEKTRIGHNHWVTDKAAEALDHPERRGLGRKMIEDLVEKRDHFSVREGLRASIEILGTIGA